MYINETVTKSSKKKQSSFRRILFTNLSRHKRKKENCADVREWEVM